MKYSEEKINEIEKNIIKGINSEDEDLLEIEQLSKSIAARLISSNHTKEKLYGTEYIFNISCDEAKKEIVVMCTDLIKFNIANGHYRPCIARCKVDKAFTYEENVYAIVKAIVSSKAGKIQVEEINE